MKYIWDIHCHIIPGVDDGAKTIDESLALLKEEARQGVYDIILTPHFRIGMFEPSPELVRQQYQALLDALQEMGQTELWAASMKLYLGCEFHATENMADFLRSGQCPTLAGSVYVLTEFLEEDTFDYIWSICTNLQRNGYIPVIAHAERIDVLRKGDYKAMSQLTAAGILIQLNADSVLGKISFSTKMWCRGAIRRKLVHFVASDAHDLTNRAPHMKECAEYLLKTYGYQTAVFLMKGNARSCFENRLQES